MATPALFVSPSLLSFASSSSSSCPLAHYVDSATKWLHRSLPSGCIFMSRGKASESGNWEGEGEEKRRPFESPVLQSHKLRESDVLLQTLNLSHPNVSFQRVLSQVRIADEIRAPAANSVSASCVTRFTFCLPAWNSRTKKDGGHLLQSVNIAEDINTLRIGKRTN